MQSFRTPKVSSDHRGQRPPHGFIEKFSEGLGEKYNIPEIAFDRWGSVQMVQNLEGRMNKSFRSSNKNGCCIVPLVTFHGYDKLFVKVLKF